MGKWLVATYTVGQVLLIRSAAAMIVMAPNGLARRLALPRGGREAEDTDRPRPALHRRTDGFYAAVIYLPFADVMTFYLAGPIWVAALSPFMLGEKVGWRRWTAIGVGFVGVVIALNPSAQTLSAPALISIAGSVAFALMVVMSRQLRNTPDLTLVFWQTAGALVAGILIAPFGWVPPTPRDWVLLGALGVIAMAAHFRHQSLAEARTGRGRRALPVHAAALGAVCSAGSCSATCRRRPC